jgi:excisionase family DNA binding protein
MFAVTEHERRPLRLLTVVEAAAELGVHESYVRELLDEGQIGAVKRGKEWRIPYVSLEVWVRRVAEGDFAAAEGRRRR